MIPDWSAKTYVVTVHEQTCDIMHGPFSTMAAAEAFGDALLTADAQGVVVDLDIGPLYAPTRTSFAAADVPSSVVVEPRALEVARGGPVVETDRYPSPTGCHLTGLNLCDPRQILTPEQQRELDADLAALANRPRRPCEPLANQRRAAEANCRGLWLS